MSVRKTSIDVYRQIEANGLLGRLQFEVYAALFHHGPLTQNELHQDHFAKTQPRNIQPRVSELEAMGAVESVGERPCRITGHRCMIWDVTANLPVKVEKKKPAEIIAELMAEVAQLKASLAERDKRIMELMTQSPKKADRERAMQIRMW